MALANWCSCARLRQQIHATGDAVLTALLEELPGYPLPEGAADLQLDGEHLAAGSAS
jgi:hypothetical protein